jgi:putative NIF3 family GTP cyclohydrolase 1 type 2
MIMSYHPPIFQAMKRLTQADVKQRIVIRCIENQCAIYSPHSALVLPPPSHALLARALGSTALTHNHARMTPSPVGICRTAWPEASTTGLLKVRALSLQLRAEHA